MTEAKATRFKQKDCACFQYNGFYAIITHDNGHTRVLATIEEANMGINLDAADIIANIQETADGADIQLCFPYPAKSAFAEIAAVAREKLARKALLMHDFLCK